jgi:hypothetical protein
MTGFTLTMDGNASIDVKMYKSTDMSTPIKEVTVSALNTKKVNTAFTTPLDLPFTDEYGQVIRYFMVYERTDNVMPRDNLFSCNCGGGDHSWQGSFDQYLGFQLADMESLTADVMGSDIHSMGIQLQGSVSCDTTEWMCASSWDYKTNAFAAVIAKIIQLMSINKLIGAILQSSTINRYTLMSREGIMSRYNMNRQAVEGQLLWLGMNLGNYAMNLSDCFTCRANSIYTKKDLLV